MSFSTFRERFDPILLTTLASKRETLPAVQDAFLEELLAYPSILLGKGKRIRPYLASLAYEGLGGTVTDDILVYFSALEIFHLFCLIHDDIIDEGTTRHGFPTIHTFAKGRLQTLHRTGDAQRTSEAYALLLGDLLLAWSFSLMQQQCPGSARVRSRNQELFYQMSTETMIGQLIDVDLTTKTETTTELIEQKMILKTARYTFTRPLELGASLQHWSKPIERFCVEFGNALGTAFQIQDDLLDLLGDPAKTQKNIFSDLASRQHTFYTQHVQAHGTAADRALLNNLFGRVLSYDEQLQAQDLFERSGAINACTRRAETEFNRAEKLIEKTRILQNKPAFQELIAAIRTRVS